MIKRFALIAYIRSPIIVLGFTLFPIGIEVIALQVSSQWEYT